MMDPPHSRLAAEQDKCASGIVSNYLGWRDRTGPEISDINGLLGRKYDHAVWRSVCETHAGSAFNINSNFIRKSESKKDRRKLTSSSSTCTTLGLVFAFHRARLRPNVCLFYIKRTNLATVTSILSSYHKSSSRKSVNISSQI